MNIGENIRKHRINSNLSQAELAKRVHVSRVMISKYERNLLQPTEKIGARLGRVLKTDPCFFYEKDSFNDNLEDKKRKHILLICFIAFLIFSVVEFGLLFLPLKIYSGRDFNTCSIAYYFDVAPVFSSLIIVLLGLSISCSLIGIFLKKNPLTPILMSLCLISNILVLIGILLMDIL